jgi:hypothetical protein
MGGGKNRLEAYRGGLPGILLPYRKFLSELVSVKEA